MNYFLIVLVVLGVFLAALFFPYIMFAQNMNPDIVGSYGQWTGNAIILCASFFAFHQLYLSKKQSETEVFLKICDMVDDDGFKESYDEIRKNKKILQNDEIASHGLATLDSNLRNAAIDVLYQLEKIGTLFNFSTLNKEMVTDYIGDVVVQSHSILSNTISYYQKDMPDAYKRFNELQKACITSGWSEDAATRIAPAINAALARAHKICKGTKHA
jgi:hypothetical protein